VLPWLGLTGLGLLLGRGLTRAAPRAYRAARLAGAAGLLLFVLLRRAGGYGHMPPPAGPSGIDLLNVTKYPPSLTFILLTLGVDLLGLGLGAVLARPLQLARGAGPLRVCGRMPLFFDLAHLFLFGLLGLTVPPAGGGSSACTPTGSPG
jgi:uncharacterized membrane protein